MLLPEEIIGSVALLSRVIALFQYTSHATVEFFTCGVQG